MSTLEVELAWLIHKIHQDKAFLEAAYEFYEEHVHDWSCEFGAYFQDVLERRYDQLHYEEHRAERLGFLIATGREAKKLNI